MVEFDSQRPLPGRVEFQLEQPAQPGLFGGTSAQGDSPTGAPHVLIGDRATGIPFAEGSSEPHAKMHAMAQAIAHHCDLQLFGIDVAIDPNGDCFVVDLNHLPNGVTTSAGFADTLANLVAERARNVRPRQR